MVGIAEAYLPAPSILTRRFPLPPRMKSKRLQAIEYVTLELVVIDPAKLP